MKLERCAGCERPFDRAAGDHHSAWWQVFGADEEHICCCSAACMSSWAQRRFMLPPTQEVAGSDGVRNTDASARSTPATLPVESPYGAQGEPETTLIAGHETKGTLPSGSLRRSCYGCGHPIERHNADGCQCPDAFGDDCECWRAGAFLTVRETA